jgi:hypothetical protein
MWPLARASSSFCYDKKDSCNGWINPNKTEEPKTMWMFVGYVFNNNVMRNLVVFLRFFLLPRRNALSCIPYVVTTKKRSAEAPKSFKIKFSVALSSILSSINSQYHHYHHRLVHNIHHKRVIVQVVVLNLTALGEKRLHHTPTP